MIFTYFKIWLKVVSKKITLKYLAILSVSIILSLFLFNIVLIFLLIIIIQSFRLFIFYKHIEEDELFYTLKLKPVNPIFGLLIYNQNPLDIFILIPILFYLKIKK